MYDLDPYQSQAVEFVMVDALGTEVAGLGAGLTVQLSIAGGAPVPSTGVQTEIGLGWYRYVATALECLPGPLAFAITAPGCIQQNLVYKVKSLAVNATDFTYTVTNIVTGSPIDGAQCWFYTDIAMTNCVWTGFTDAFGVARDVSGNLPFLDFGTYYIRRHMVGYTFADPDTEIVS